MSTSSAPRPGGSRRAVKARRYRGDRTLLAALAVLVLAAAAVLSASGAAPPGGDTTAERGPTGVPVERTVLACPDATDTAQIGARARTTVEAGLSGVKDLLGAGVSLGSEGTVTVGRAGRAGRDRTLDRGELVDLRAGRARVLDAEGSAAVGLFGYRTDRTPRGTAVARCVEPRGTWWFAGAGGSLDHNSDLVLANVDPGPAVVDVRVYGPDGPIETVGTRGIPIAPNGSQTLAMADVAPQTEELLVEVVAVRGRVAAAVADRYAAGAEAAGGLEWLPGTDRPSRNLRLVGLPARAASRTLLVANAGDRQALVELQLAGSAGGFTPSGLDETSVAPGSVESVDLSAVVPPGEPVAVRVRSTAPVVATVRSVGRSGGRSVGRDTSYAGAAAPLVDPAAVPVLEQATTTVQLTAGSLPARARLSGFTRTGRVSGRNTVAIDATATATWQPARRTAYVVVRPIKGSVYGAATYAGGGALSQTPLVGLPLTVVTPRVVPGPR